jgi:hypothetical protein
MVQLVIHTCMLSVELLLSPLVVVTDAGLVSLIELGNNYSNTKRPIRRMVSVFHQTLAIHTASFSNLN